MPIAWTSPTSALTSDATPAALPFCTAIDQRSVLPERSLVNRMCFPSGVHAGF